MNPFFIAFEGIDGSGKSTQAGLLAETLKKKQLEVFLTAEPSRGAIGRMIREILTGGMVTDDRTLAALFAADRLDHILNPTEGMLAHMQAGNTIICDRYYLSSYAYHGTQMDMQWVIQTNAMAAEILRPDLHIFIDAEPELCMQRIRQNREGTERFETMETLTAVREKYIEAITMLRPKETIEVIDGNRSRDEVASAVGEAVKKHLGL